MNNKLKLDTTMLQSNSAMHLIAFMLTQRDLLVELLAIIELHEKNVVIHRKYLDTLLADSSNDIHGFHTLIVDSLDDPPLKRRIKEVAEDFEYILKKHTTAIHRRSGTKIYKKDKCIECESELDTWSTVQTNKKY
tara:strand:+ start:1678 stop:2082 length:405 start_codon:yes stop_codon:yes gene_type:complete